MLCAVRVRLCHLCMALCAMRLVLAACVRTREQGEPSEYPLACLGLSAAIPLRLLSSLWRCVACLSVGYLLSGG